MTPSESDRTFAGSIPQLYEQYMVPLIFAPYAEDLRRRVLARQPRDVLEIACGTGVVTRQLAAALPAATAITATDLNQPMLDHAVALGVSRPVTWRQADAQQLPFPDAAFDLVVCQFGAMFFPDKRQAYAQARRVLRPGGVFIFSVWDRIGENDFANVINQALIKAFPADPPPFMARTPYGYFDAARIAQELLAAGFAKTPVFETVAARSRAPSARTAATAFCQGTPWHGEIEARRKPTVAEATGMAEAALAERFGGGEVEGRIQALVVTIEN
ncbi:class I SAM-dependent methyltransferase [Rugamonas apoptosis]|uniref:Methyltransferase domain-containing protein n=1 Tax=Rugamonas apoptosis TaxID=2758570 RepID=A0A7W2FEY0_9BURK|nr:class I SAM-dependent methyltransferase [Rugamonas apoptosis]MBA5690430.1 methyltransferase domain-containing protein [Rugamonas apoptosis]